MRKVALVAVVLAVSLLASTAASGRMFRAGLRLVDRSPLTVEGRSFKAAERVRVTVSASGVVERKTIRASRSGSFRAVFTDLTLGPCTGFRVSAAGSGGSRAKLNPPPLPACIAAIGSG
jgi:hypothetical protein